MGSAAPSLLDSTVRVTIRQSDSEAIASEAATASNSRFDATAIAGLVKPVGPKDRVMVQQILNDNGAANQSPRGPHL